MLRLFPFYRRVFVIIAFMAISCRCKQPSEKKPEIDKTTRVIGVYNFDNAQELTNYNALNLEESHPNLLNPQISKSDYSSVMASWTDLHQRLGNYLSKHNFNWDVNDDTITIVHKIYFEPNGKIENYFFNVLNQRITMEKKEQFAQLISDFAATNRIDFKQDHSFAQCGKTSYLNK